MRPPTNNESEWPSDDTLDQGTSTVDSSCKLVGWDWVAIQIRSAITAEAASEHMEA